MAHLIPTQSEYLGLLSVQKLTLINIQRQVQFALKGTRYLPIGDELPIFVYVLHTTNTSHLTPNLNREFSVSALIKMF